MKNLILVSHGHFCHELKKSTEMIMGPQNTIFSVGLETIEGAEEFREKLVTIINKLEGDFLIFADLLGGTPCNVASQLLLAGYHFELYAGMNMPMIIAFLNSQMLDQDIDLRSFARENIYFVNALLEQKNDEEDEV
ncbi:PTS sugar transporter subunit IIA [Streptococcus pseudoporcinus]|uniref:PTS system fructose family transporter subunit IIA n=1 Tax=Streptococcus pseudoporcinus TaxID=361101 RepID=A0A4U9XJF3_9STRE|nr:PTS fructose transporter subunit IIA [Streptococcus pseudoporcinus]VTS13384.1 PTS system fructose family transporter subunit IIA [Streptococcus pseudoporcinus]VUC66563.1 PTS system fructose family transporter subunit IIA [Streptococcus pseudoporcinus]VUC97492.1 PTS system fructose family transporter subunit IIA [Streptococcus pseudoporcinus]VUC97883.1 PTS system fructose family transporter subunit IIA [Streptococcus pseudoporcinus]